MGRDEVRSKKLNSRYQAREPFKIRSGGSVRYLHCCMADGEKISLL